jgi:hypothetical protein
MAASHVDKTFAAWDDQCVMPFAPFCVVYLKTPCLPLNRTTCTEEPYNYHKKFFLKASTHIDFLYLKVIKHVHKNSLRRNTKTTEAIMNTKCFVKNKFYKICPVSILSLSCIIKSSKSKHFTFYTNLFRR